MDRAGGVFEHFTAVASYRDPDTLAARAKQLIITLLTDSTFDNIHGMDQDDGHAKSTEGSDSQVQR